MLRQGRDVGTAPSRFPVTRCPSTCGTLWKHVFPKTGTVRVHAEADGV